MKKQQFKVIERLDGRIEIQCSCGVGHTVAVPIEWKKTWKNIDTAFLHGCCGDCSTTEFVNFQHNLHIDKGKYLVC